MILDKLEHRNYYLGLHSKFETAFKFLTENKVEEFENGRYEIDGTDVYALVQSYTTSPLEAKRWEAHEKYIDIQFVVKGREMIGWAPIEQMKVSQPYNVEKDIVFYEETGEYTALNMTDGYFAILFPDDAHKPGCIYGNAEDVKKVVIKIKL